METKFSDRFKDENIGSHAGQILRFAQAGRADTIRPGYPVKYVSPYTGNAYEGRLEWNPNDGDNPMVRVTREATINGMESLDELTPWHAGWERDDSAMFMTEQEIHEAIGSREPDDREKAIQNVVGRYSSFLIMDEFNGIYSSKRLAYLLRDYFGPGNNGIAFDYTVLIRADKDIALAKDGEIKVYDNANRPWGYFILDHLKNDGSYLLNFPKNFVIAEDLTLEEAQTHVDRINTYGLASSGLPEDYFLYDSPLGVKMVVRKEDYASDPNWMATSPKAAIKKFQDDTGLSLDDQDSDSGFSPR